MIGEKIRIIVNEQKYEYIQKRDIIEEALTKEELETVWARRVLNEAELKKIRTYVLWLEGEENCSSFEEWMLHAMRTLKKEISRAIRVHIKQLKFQWNVSEDFLLWMEEVKQLIK